MKVQLSMKCMHTNKVLPELSYWHTQKQEEVDSPDQKPQLNSLACMFKDWINAGLYSLTGSLTGSLISSLFFAAYVMETRHVIFDNVAF